MKTMTQQKYNNPDNDTTKDTKIKTTQQRRNNQSNETAHDTISNFDKKVHLKQEILLKEGL